MDVTAFYSIVAGTCFTLVGLWWNVVQSHKEWFADETTRSLTAGVYASFFIPAVMSLGAQVSGTSQLIWQVVFVLAAATGMVSTSRLINKTKLVNASGLFRRNHWAVVVLYGLVILFGMAPGLGTTLTGMQPLQVEGILLVILIIIAHGLAWEFMTEAQTKKY
jgi:hypothetical protein